MTKHEFLLNNLNSVKDDDTVSLILLNLDLEVIITDKQFYVDLDIKHTKSNTYIFENRFYTDNDVLYEDDFDTRLLYQSYKTCVLEVILAVSKFEIINKINK